jgi:hypothetical protein
MKFLCHTVSRLQTFAEGTAISSAHISLHSRAVHTFVTVPSSSYLTARSGKWKGHLCQSSGIRPSGRAISSNQVVYGQVARPSVPNNFRGYFRFKARPTSDVNMWGALHVAGIVYHYDTPFQNTHEDFVQHVEVRYTRHSAFSKTKTQSLFVSIKHKTSLVP